ncbi:MAG TPA: hypothetical protein VGM65_03245 [Candidatus Udaeobacter sp.]|jgi:hypothetical protein
MPLRNRFGLSVLLLLLIVVLTVVLAPFAVSNGVRLWVWWFARQEGIVASIDKIEAPFLRPIVIRQLQLKSARDDTLRIDVTMTDVRFTLNLKHILVHTSGHDIRNLSIGELRAEVHRSNPNTRTLSEKGWTTLHRLLPENFSIAKLETRVESGPTLILLRNASLSASETEPGRFTAAELMVASPWVRQTFSQLRGATHWETNRLTVAGITLTHGLDLQSATVDLSRLGNQRIGLQFDVDAFGGKLRGNISHEWHSQHSNWKIAGGAGDLSLAQISDALGFADRVKGVLHAGNFTFRGNLAEPDRATASLWCELTDLTWRDRTAEAIMLGAALYNRKIELQQLYIRQKSNQFTLSGEAALPASSSEWLQPDFGGNISASINQLGDFLALFGANPTDFSGKISVEGSMDTRGRKFGGHLAIQGESLTFFNNAIDSLGASLNLKASELEIEQLDLTRKNDYLSGQGAIDLSPQHNYSGTIDVCTEDLRDYFPNLRGSPGQKSRAIPGEIQATINFSHWDTHGAIQLPKSSAITFAANFPLPLGTTWSAFQMSPVRISADFPAIFLATAPQFFHSDIFQDGILSGKISLSETLQHPSIAGDVQLINGKLSSSSDAFSNVVEATSRITFDTNRASLEFLNLASKDVDLALGGEIDFKDINDVVVRIIGATPVFDLTSRPIDCVNKIEIVPAALPLAPAVTELEFRGALFEPDWSVTLKEEVNGQSLITSASDSVSRTFPLCFVTGPEENPLLLGAVPRAEAAPKARSKKPEKQR